MNDLEKAGVKIVKLLQKEGFQAFWVGGMVRDRILKRSTDNMDITTDALPEQVEKILVQEKLPSKSVGKGRTLGTVLTIVDGFQVEITTFRAEGFYSDKRHPDQVQFIKDYLQDAKRRDFTINALYFDPIKKELYDPTGGQKDLRAKLIRFVGDPKKRIDEDSLRMLRAVRFATQFGFKLEKNTFAAIKTRAKYIQGVSGERIKKELDKILLARNRAEGIRILDDIGLLKFIIPEFEALKKFSHKSKKYHLEGSQFDHTLLCLKAMKVKSLSLVYALLFHDIGKPEVAKRIHKDGEWVLTTRGHNISSAKIFTRFAARLKFPNTEKASVIWLIENHMYMSSFIRLTEAEQLRLVMNSDFELLLEHWRCDESGNERVDYNDDHSKRYRQSDRYARNLLKSYKANQFLIEKLAKGDLIMKYSGLKPGKQLGQKIEEIKARIILGQIKSEKDLKNFLRP